MTDETTTAPENVGTRRDLLTAAAVAAVGYLALYALSGVGHQHVCRYPSQLTCINNLRDLQFAVMSYTTEHGQPPPLYTVAPDGRRLHSWRTLLLPHLDSPELYAAIDLSKLWDDPANARLSEQAGHLFGCRSLADPSATTYVATGPFPDITTFGVPGGELEDMEAAAKSPMLMECALEDAVRGCRRTTCRGRSRSTRRPPARSPMTG